MVPDRYLRAWTSTASWAQANNPEWKTLAFDESGKVVLPNGAIGFRWGAGGRADAGNGIWRPRRRVTAIRVKLKLSCWKAK